jgi:hypothetical protein
MDKKKNRTNQKGLIVLGMLLAIGSATLHSSGKTAANFLKIPAGVRNVGMGETGAASLDINSIYYNPAGLGWLTKPELTFSHNQHFQDVYLEHIAGAMPIRDWGVFGLSVYYLGMSDIAGYDGSGNAAGSVSANDSAVSLSYSRYVMGERIEGNGLCVGGTLKYINSKLDDASGSGVGLDLGVEHLFAPSAYTLDNSLSVGLSIQNLGSKIKYDSKSAGLPVNLRLGALYSIVGHNMKPSIALDLTKSSDSDAYAGLGGEVWIRDILALRVGYASKGSRATDGGLRFGVGLKSYGLTMDYAYAGYGDLGTEHRVGLSINFDTVGGQVSSGPADVNKVFQRGVELFNQERWLEATLEFNKVLELDSTNKDALDYMRRANEKLNKR